MNEAMPMDPRVSRLKEGFDQGFAELPAPRNEERQAFLAIQIAGDPYVLQAGQIAGLLADKRLASLPGQAAGFLGLLGLRGQLWPAWDLGALAGYPASAKAMRWAVLAAGPQPWAAVFGGFEGYLDLPGTALRPYEGQGAAAAFSKQAVLADGSLRPVLDLSLLMGTIIERSRR